MEDWKKVSKLIPGRTYIQCIEHYEAFLKLPPEQEITDIVMTDTKTCQEIAEEYKKVPGRMRVSPTAATNLTMEKTAELDEPSKIKAIGNKLSSQQWSLNTSPKKLI